MDVTRPGERVYIRFFPMRNTDDGAGSTMGGHCFRLTVLVRSQLTKFGMASWATVDPANPQEWLDLLPPGARVLGRMHTLSHGGGEGWCHHPSRQLAAASPDTVNSSAAAFSFSRSCRPACATRG